MACVNSPRVEALVQHCPHTEEDGDSDIEFVCQETGTQLQYHPILSAVAQLLRERLEEQHTGSCVTESLTLGPPYHEYNGNAAKEDYEHYSPSKEDHECDWDSAEEDCECDWDPAEEDYERDWDPDEEDYERDRDPAEEDCERVGDPDGEDCERDGDPDGELSWSELNISWGIFMEWLSEHWWGPVSEDEVISFMNLDKRRPGDVVVAAPFGGSPGAVCSISIKTKNSVLSTDVVICGRFYRCVQLLPGKFSDPCKVIRHLVRGMKHVQLQPRSKTIPSNAMYFSATHVAEQLRSMMGMSPRIFWGTYERAESSSRYQEMMLRLRMKSRKFTNPEMRKGEFLHPAAIMHCTGDVGSGYLFEVITDQGRKIVVTFDRLGFTVGNGSHFYEITSVLSYISSVERVVFVTVPRSWDSVRSPEPPTMETGETSNSH
ncbi:hypothetical protein D9C73_000040 [Collichthys lucidus]|uniref:Uncharacterized protein n=1 Tax=Collichthys lucidus TaxID=240159 RepID=A0A4U5TWG3_COLLU|nr:hypothetical protein D9C73_000040 [Collichthys lucidus]